MDFHKIIDEFCELQKISTSVKKIDNFWCYEIAADNLLQIIGFLKKNEDLRFSLLTDLFAVDFLQQNKHFEVVYSLLSFKLNRRVLIKVLIEEGGSVPSISDVHSSACWYEREAFDMFGIHFTNSPDLRRILTDYSFVGHPLRKDFPLSGHVQITYDEKHKKVVYEPVKLEQEYRDFDFTSAWSGPQHYNLPGDEKSDERAKNGEK